ncbi:MAG: efflux RND transporter permease subunit, partial [Candidatus Gastranaerophilales bacterium]|nr:efflux RND transporter permease subunit [Candidatus Gastranaerophilales bacterium]
MFSNFFIDRPRFAIVISIIIVLAGLISITKLPLEEYPMITPPQICVNAVYPGADAEVVESSVASVIEAEINGVEDMLYMNSSSTNGAYELEIFFKVGTNSDMALVKVQNRLQLANARLPEEVKRYGLGVKERVGGPGLMLISLYSPNEMYDDIMLSNYGSVYVKDELARIKGVGEVEIFGAKDFGMRIWLNPDKMASLGVTPSEISAAINAQNIQIAAGSVGQEPIVDKQKFQLILKTKGRLKTVAEFEDIIVRSNLDGSSIKIKDIARVELGSQNYTAYGRVNGDPCIIMSVKQLSDANSIQVANDITKKMQEISSRFPDGVKYQVIRDETDFVKKSLSEVIKTILIALILVVAITYVFLGDFRSTLIPFFAMPVALIGTLTFLNIFGFSINTITLFGLVLAVGTVVDDAIVVIENVQRHIENGENPRDAAFKTMSEVGGAVIATTLVLLAVFVPVAFLPGITGKLYKQFAVGISVAVSLSTLVALTLSPALSATILKAQKDRKVRNENFFDKFNKVFNKIANEYIEGAKLFINNQKLTIIIVLSLFFAAGVLYKFIPSGFLPDEDKAVTFTYVQLPDGASLARTNEVVKKLEAKVKNFKGVIRTITYVGFGGSNSGFIVCQLDDWSKRQSKDLSISAMLNKMNKVLGATPDAQVTTFAPSPIPGLGMFGGFEFQLQDIGDNSPQYLAQQMGMLLMKANQDSRLQRVFSTFQANLPQLMINVDTKKALAQGVSLTEIYSTLNSYFGSSYINDFNKLGRVFKVQMQADSDFRRNPADIEKIYVKNSSGEILPITSVVDIKSTVGPLTLSRFNQFRSVQISGSPGQDMSSGQAIAAMSEIAKRELPNDMSFEWSG